MSSSTDNYKTKSPVLLLLFNRPDETIKLIDALSKVRPQKIYISIDGNREGNKDDIENQAKILDIINEKIQWTKEVSINNLSINYGCGIGPRKGISWFFENVDSGIILEDDCIPSISFFKFCDYLLPKYANTQKVWLISGDNGGPILPEKYFTNSDYLYTNIPLIWGWATWSDRWKKYDEELDNWKKGIIYNYSFFKHVNFFEKFIVSRICKGASRTKIKNFWDFQLYSTMLKNNGLGVIPKNNLISNIGWGDLATHTKVENNRSHSVFLEEELTISPKKLESHKLQNSLITYKAHTNVTDKYINTDNISLLRIGYMVSRTVYYFNFIIKAFYSKKYGHTI